MSVVLVVGIHTDSAFMAHYLGCTTPYTIKQLMHILVSTIHTYHSTIIYYIIKVISDTIGLSNLGGGCQ